MPERYEDIVRKFMKDVHDAKVEARCRRCCMKTYVENGTWFCPTPVCMYEKTPESVYELTPYLREYMYNDESAEEGEET